MPENTPQISTAPTPRDWNTIIIDEDNMIQSLEQSLIIHKAVLKIAQEQIRQPSKLDKLK